MWGLLGTFGPDCLESLIPETYASGGSLSSSVVPYGPDMEPGAAFHSNSKPILFTWVPLGNFLRLFKNRFHSHCEGFCLFLCPFLPFFLFLIFPTIIDCLNQF